jgi:glycogen phosphorylase
MAEVMGKYLNKQEPFIRTRITKKARKIAYFSMEIGLDSRMPTYSGGLGVLSGDALRSYADLSVPVIGVTLLYKKGYFYQKIDPQGDQIELPYQWNPQDFLISLKPKVKIRIKNQDISIKSWQYTITGINGYKIPVIFLDTDIKENTSYQRSLSYYLYGGDGEYRLFQEAVLGIGGVKMLQQLGYKGLTRYHMNEGHASLLTLELLRRFRKKNGHWDIESVRKHCVFTTHTPVPAGHDRFSYDLVSSLLKDYVPIEFLKEISNGNELNMTKLALHLSHYINGVGRQHKHVSREMFPGYHVDSITNGVHSSSWVSSSFKALYDKYILGWQKDPSSLRYALSIPRREIWQAHTKEKKKLLDLVFEKTGQKLDENVLTIGFARRATAYKRAELVFYDIQRLVRISEKVGKVQFIFSGKAHSQD